MFWLINWIPSTIVILMMFHYVLGHNGIETRTGSTYLIVLWRSGKKGLFFPAQHLKTKTIWPHNALYSPLDGSVIANNQIMHWRHH